MGTPGEHLIMQYIEGVSPSFVQSGSNPPSGELTELDREVARRRTFAIISHPDAGKTTLTEKLLLYAGAIELAGAVRARGARRHATSDWMELEQQRGISIYQFSKNCGFQPACQHIQIPWPKQSATSPRRDSPPVVCSAESRMSETWNVSVEELPQYLSMAFGRLRAKLDKNWRATTA